MEPGAASNARSFLRVRGFTPSEAVVCPDPSPVPRGILHRRDQTISVLDPLNRFKPKRNGVYNFENVLWSYVEPGLEPDVPIDDQAKVYESTVKPVIPSIVSGYNAAFLVTGSAESGKSYTMFGDEGTATTAQVTEPTQSSILSPTSRGELSKASSGLSSPPASHHPHAPFGAPLDPLDRGIFYRFSSDIFKEFERQFQDNSTLSAEVEVVEIHNEQYMDLLSSHACRQFATANNIATTTPSSSTNAASAAGIATINSSGVSGVFQQSSSTSALQRSSSTVPKPPMCTSLTMTSQVVSQQLQDQEPVKIVLDPVEGPRLNGVVRATITTGEQLEQLVRIAVRPMRRRKSTHVVHLRFIETFEFTDPERPGKSLSKSRRISVLFAVICSPPPSFLRCVDVAAARDSNETPNAVVPYRDSAFTKLYADVFMQGYNITFISCVSPYFEHSKETQQSIQFAVKVKKIRCNPKPNHDESLVELRRLADAVKGLKTEVIKQNESMVIVQDELDKREREILRQEMILDEQGLALEECRRRRAVEETVTAVLRLRLSNQQSRHAESLSAIEAEIALRGAMLRGIVEERMKNEARLKERRSKAEELDALRREHQSIAAPFIKRIEERNQSLRELVKLEEYIAAEPEERQRDVAASFKEREELTARIPQLEAQRREARGELGDAKIRHDELKPQYDEVVAGERRIAEVEQLKKQLQKLQSETAAIEADQVRVQGEIDRTPKAGCCAVM